MRPNVTRHEPELVMATARARITWLLTNPAVSDWLKTALRAADGYDAISLQNDLQILQHLIAPLANCPIDTAMLPLSVQLADDCYGAHRLS